MAVANPAVKPSPSARRARIVALTLIYLCFVILWVITAGMTATIVARRACRKGSVLLVFLEAFNDAAASFSICIFFIFLALAAVQLCGLCLAYLVAVVCGSGAAFKKSVFGAITPQGPTPEPPRALVLGLVAYLALFLLTAAGILVELMSPHVEGSMSQGQRIASVIEDVGVVGRGAISCFVIIPALALVIWRKDQVDRHNSELKV
ncbi:unnamed protein product [Alopecurus aequalis]